MQEYKCVVGVSDATLQVRRSEIFCIMGLSGSGKSTLIRLLNRLIERSLKSRDLSTLDARAFRETRARHIGMVFQSVTPLPQRTVLKNAASGLEVQGIPRDDRNRAAEASLAKVGLSDWKNRYPRELSGGMQQRVTDHAAFIFDTVRLVLEAFMTAPCGSADAAAPPCRSSPR